MHTLSTGNARAIPAQIAQRPPIRSALGTLTEPIHILPPISVPLSAVDYPKLREAVSSVFRTICTKSDSSYSNEFAVRATHLGTNPESLLTAAISQAESGKLAVDVDGRVINPHSLGQEFGMVMDFVSSRMEVHLIADPIQVEIGKVPVSRKYRHYLETIIAAPDKGREVVTILIVKMPPDEVRDEIRRITNTKFHGISLWLDVDRRQHFEHLMSPALRDWLDHANIRIMRTGDKECACDIAKRVNHDLQAKDGLERRHIERLVQSISESEQVESLQGVLKVCIPIIISIKILEKYYPGALHVVGSVLDDLFGTILPDVSQSIGKLGSRWERVKQGSLVFLGGSFGLPVSFVCSGFSLYLHEVATSAIQRGFAGALFAFACCAGTVGTSVAAVVKAYKGIKKFEADIGETSSYLRRLYMAFDEALLKVPFRIGHTLVGLPAQLVLGLGAGMLGLFHHPGFIVAAGILDTAIGAAFAFLYPKIAAERHEKKLREG